ncbi:MAG: hypothetical protein M3R57_08730, partial [Chloroflexota bacterium]|nr:hypothetical protein [Chloroflexota bacterium]
AKTIPLLLIGAIAGLVGAVLLDTGLLYLLGGLGQFIAPFLIAVHVAILALGLRARPIIRPGSLVLGRPALPWAIVIVAWLGVVALQLASPVIPFLDVLPNHVAPVERLRTFGVFEFLTETQSPIYGPSRTFLGYVGLLGTVTTMTGLPAGLAVSAFVLPGSLLVAAGVHRLANAIGGPGTGLWALIAFTLTESFARMTDARATVLALPLVLGALAWFVERTAVLEAEPPNGGPQRPSIREALLFGGALGAAVLFHPVMGALAVATVGLIVLARPRTAPLGVPAIGVAAALAVPQALTMLGIALPSLVALEAVIPAILIARLLAHPMVGRIAVILGRAILVALVPLGLVFADRLIAGAATGLGDIAKTIPLLLIGAIAGLLVAPRVAGNPVILAAIAAGSMVAVLTRVVPEADGLLDDAIRFELPKTLHYWLPVFAALAAGIGLHRWWSRPGIATPIRAGVVGVFLVAAAIPLRTAPIDDHYLGEHRFSELLAIDLRHAGRGYWVGYPDSRHVVDASRAELLEAVRSEIRAGRITGATNLLHVAPTFQQWSATPFGVFTGIRETVASPDAIESIHTVGGRLRPIAQLDQLLASHGFAYVVFEPGKGVPGDARERILAAAFRSIFRNDQGELFAAP